MKNPNLPAALRQALLQIASSVAQGCTLPYRRVSLCEGHDFAAGFECSPPTRFTTPCRVQPGDTAGWNPALRIFRKAALFSLVAFAMFAGAFPLRADVHLPAIFGDHMVLQQSAKLPVWGWATPGEKITVTFKDQTATTVATADGSWRVDLKPCITSSQPGVLSVAGNNKLVFSDVLVGDVWVLSGQSNMEFGIQSDSRGTNAIATATVSQIRLFFVNWLTALQPQSDIGPANPSSALNGKWLVCSPEIMRSKWAWNGFSAVGYYFAREIRQANGHPLGMIASYKGATGAQAWTSISGLEKEPTLAHFVVEHQKLVDNFTNAQAAFAKQQADYRAALKTADAARAAGQAPAGRRAPQPPKPADGGFPAPANLWNGMVTPLIPFAIKGVLWYQGESNADRTEQAVEYAVLFPRMISDWREKWGQGNFPFLYVQLPYFNAEAKTSSEGRWSWLRDVQLKTLSLPATGMAVTIDTGDVTNIHPPDKTIVGQRLALVARHVAYGENLVCSGPLYDSMAVEGNKIRLKFTSVGGGLKMGMAPVTATGKTFAPPTELRGFGIAGADQKFVWAGAVLDGNTVLVSSDAVAQPAAVRYDWAQNPSGNLYNQESLPASPFRTDNWPADIPAR